MENILLVPIDGSQQSLKAVEHAVELAESMGLTIELLNVQSAFNTHHAYKLIGKKKLQEHKQECAKKILSEGEKQVNQRVAVIVKIREGVAVQEICQEAMEINAKEIVIAAKESKIKGRGVGYNLVKKAPCPVTIVT